MTTDTHTEAHRYALTIRDELVDLAHGELDGCQPEGPADAVMTWINDLALDVNVTRNLTTGDVTAVEVARTIGGPSCYVTFRHGEVTVATAWGVDRAEVHVTPVEAHTLADLILDLAEAFR
jgi:hypothetical protein